MPSIIGDNIRRARLASGMTQAQLGKAAGGRDATQINAYECGRSVPTDRVLNEIAVALGTAIDALKGTITLASPVAVSKTKIASLISELEHLIMDALGNTGKSVRISIDLM